MDTKTDRRKEAASSVTAPKDTDSFRTAVETVLEEAIENGVDIKYTSWKCETKLTTTWEVEITPVDQS